MMNYLMENPEEIKYALTTLKEGDLLRFRCPERMRTVFFFKFENQTMYYVSASDYWKTGIKKPKTVLLHRIKSIRVIG